MAWPRISPDMGHSSTLPHKCQTTTTTTTLHPCSDGTHGCDTDNGICGETGNFARDCPHNEKNKAKGSKKEGEKKEESE